MRSIDEVRAKCTVGEFDFQRCLAIVSTSDAGPFQLQVVEAIGVVLLRIYDRAAVSDISLEQQRFHFAARDAFSVMNVFQMPKRCHAKKIARVTCFQYKNGILIGNHRRPFEYGLVFRLHINI